MSLTITRKVTVSGGTVLRAANNLGDVASASASRGNLGFATTTTDNAIVRFDGVTGQTQNSGVTIDDSGKLMASPTLTGSSGTVSGAKVGSTINQSGTAGYDVLLVDASTAAAGSGSKYLIRATTGDSVTQFSVDNSGNTAITGNLTVSGVTSIPDGSTAAPSFRFNADTDTGLARAATDTLEIVAGGTRTALATPTGFRILGTTTNDNAATGYVGEYVSSTVVVGSKVALATDTAVNVTSISLTAGDWDVEFGAYIKGALTGTYASSSISTASATMSYGEGAFFSAPTMPTGASDVTQRSTSRVSLSGTTTYYGVALASYSGGTGYAYGRLSARRVR